MKYMNNDFIVCIFKLIQHTFIYKGNYLHIYISVCVCVSMFINQFSRVKSTQLSSAKSAERQFNWDIKYWTSQIKAKYLKLNVLGVAPTNVYAIDHFDVEMCVAFMNYSYCWCSKNFFSGIFIFFFLTPNKKIGVKILLWIIKTFNEN